jgi:hypothetical protein
MTGAGDECTLPIIMPQGMEADRIPAMVKGKSLPQENYYG